jgi:hypothetical protein
MRRPTIQELTIFNEDALASAGLTADIVGEGILYTYRMLDAMDSQLIGAGAFRLANMFELANVSSMVGNLIGSGIANASKGAFRRNGPHKYPDLLAQNSSTQDVEVKVALEKNAPKGHLVKPGYYLTCRYVLCDENGLYTPGVSARGSVVWIWEVRFGWLAKEHFNVSNTEGDSGKTAVVNAAGIKQLSLVFCDLDRCPHSIQWSSL